MPIAIEQPCPTCDGKRVVGGTETSPGHVCEKCNGSGSMTVMVPQAHVQVEPHCKVLFNGKIYRYPEELDMPTDRAVQSWPTVRILSSEPATVKLQRGLVGQEPGKANYVAEGNPSETVEIKLGKNPRGRPRKKPTAVAAQAHAEKPATQAPPQ